MLEEPLLLLRRKVLENAAGNKATHTHVLDPLLSLLQRFFPLRLQLFGHRLRGCSSSLGGSVNLVSQFAEGCVSRAIRDVVQA
jgi:hypothetical protein